MKHRKLVIGVVGSWVCLAGAVKAATIQYDFGISCLAGFSQCTLGGAPFVGLATMTFIGDTLSVDHSDPLRLTNVAGSAHFSSGPLTATLTSVSYVFAFPSGFGPFASVGIVGFTQPDACGPFNGCGELMGDPTLLNYDLATAFSLTNPSQPFAALSPQVFFTSAGDLVLDFATTYNFQASIIPEPASWTMLVIGFGLAGAGLRRRGRRVA